MKVIEEEILCECEDTECPHCLGECRALATAILERIDWDNEEVYMCEECAKDAIESGVFSIA